MTTSDQPSLSRRAIVGSAGIGLAALGAVGPAVAQTAAAAAPAQQPQPLQDPTTKYPRPPYAKQS